MRRLSVTIFLSLLASLLLVGAAVGFFWKWQLNNRTEAQESRFSSALAAELIPVAEEGVERLQQALWHLHRRLHVDLQVVDAQGSMIASAGKPFRVDEPQEERREAAGMPPPDAPPEVKLGPHRRGMDRRMMAVVHQVALPDARTLQIRSWRPRPPMPWFGAPVGLPILFLAVALAAWPVSRRITRRLESLKHSVDAQAAGNLKVRADVRGRDEVAALARSFNHAAERIEALVGRQEALLQSQRRLLANASHELRSPLARIRMAVELMLEQPSGTSLNDADADEVRRSIRELDALVEEILLASRLDAGQAEPLRREPVDMQKLITAETGRTGAVWMVAMEARAASASGTSEPGASAPGASTPGASEPVVGAPVAPDGSSLGGSSPNGALPASRDGLLPAASASGDDASLSIPGDPRLLRRLLRNLLENARRYQPEGDEPVLVRLSSQVRGQTPGLCIEVMDRGPGVPDEARERIFEAFYRVDGYSEQSGNVGLGLSLVRQIAQRHGGEVHHEPREGGGSVFVVWLPQG